MKCVSAAACVLRVFRPRECREERLPVRARWRAVGVGSFVRGGRVRRAGTEGAVGRADAEDGVVGRGICHEGLQEGGWVLLLVLVQHARWWVRGV